LSRNSKLATYGIGDLDRYSRLLAKTFAFADSILNSCGMLTRSLKVIIAKTLDQTILVIQAAGLIISKTSFSVAVPFYIFHFFKLLL
jgi:hypothetical protein